MAKMSAEKKTGYFLLFLGLGIILFSLLPAFDVFNGTRSPPKIFNVQKPAETLSVGGVALPVMDIVPVDYINRSGDLLFYLLFTALLIYAGGRISSIGVSLIAIREDQSKPQDKPKENLSSLFQRP